MCFLYATARIVLTTVSPDYLMCYADAYMEMYTRD